MKFFPLKINSIALILGSKLFNAGDTSLFLFNFWSSIRIIATWNNSAILYFIFNSSRYIFITSKNSLLSRSMAILHFFSYLLPINKTKIVYLLFNAVYILFLSALWIAISGWYKIWLWFYPFYYLILIFLHFIIFFINNIIIYYFLDCWF